MIACYQENVKKKKKNILRKWLDSVVFPSISVLDYYYKLFYLWSKRKYFPICLHYTWRGSQLLVLQRNNGLSLHDTPRIDSFHFHQMKIFHLLLIFLPPVHGNKSLWNSWYSLPGYFNLLYSYIFNNIMRM